MESPFVTVFDMVGIPYAADIMNFVILTAILSVGNTGLYACTRIMYSLSETGMAPKVFGKLNKRGVPSYALLVTLGFALLSLLTSYVAKRYFICCSAGCQRIRRHSHMASHSL